MSEESTTKLNIDISGLRKNIQEANRLIRVANSEFKATSSTMDNWANSADGISAKLTQLDKVLKSQDKILDSLEQQYAAVVKEQGENSKGAQELLIKINNQKAAIAKTNSEIKKWNKALEDVSDSSDDTTKSTKDLEKAIDNADDDISKISGGFTVLKGAMANLVADGIKSMISGFINLAGETREYREDMAKLQTAFDEGGFSAQEATDVYKDFYAVLGEEDRSVEAVSHLAKMVDSEKDLATWTDICTGVWGTYGDSLPIEGLTEAANETVKVGKVTGPLADALNWAGVSEDKFNESLEKCNSEQERQQLIMDTLNGLYGDAADKYRETNAEVMAANDAQSNLTDAYAAFGAKAEPIVTSVKQGFADLLVAALGLVEGVDFSQLTDKIQEGFTYLIDTILPAIQTGFGWILDNKDTIIAGIAGIAAGFVAWNVVTTIQGVVSAIKAFKLANEGATVAQLLLNAAMKANLIGIIITAITALVAAFVVLWNKSEGFRNFWIGLWEKIKKVASVVWKAITKFFTDAWKKITETWNKAKDFFSKIWQNIKNIFSVVGKVLGDFFKSAWEKVSNFWSNSTIGSHFRNVWNTIKGIFKVVKSVLSGNFSDAWAAIKDILSGWASHFSGIWTKVKNVFSSVASWFGNIFGNAWTAIKDKFSGWGDFWSGLWTKIKNKFSDIGSNIGSAISNTIKSGLNRVLSTIESTINGGIRLINSAINLANKLPGVNVSTIDTISLPRLEKGGVLKRGQVGLLEGNGAEAVVPLERNKQWIRKTANDMMSELKRQGLDISKNNVPTQINQTFNQYNNSPKALSRLDIYRQTKNQLALAKGV